MVKVNNVRDQTTTRMRWSAMEWGSVMLVVALLGSIGYAANWVRTGIGDPHKIENYAPIDNVPALLIVRDGCGVDLARRWEKSGGAMAIDCNLAVLPMLVVLWPMTHDLPRSLVAPYGAGMRAGVSWCS